MTSTASYRALNRVPRLATAIAVTVALANTARPAGALPAYLTAFEAQYPAAVGSRIDSCNLCHTTVPALNPYGTAYAGSGHQFGPIEDLDSDGDGFSNLAEIQALTFPGDAGDKPAASPSPTTTVLSATPTPTPGQTPTGTPSGSPTGSPTNTPGSHTVTPTGGGGSGTPTTTPTGGGGGGTPTTTPTGGGGAGTPTTTPTGGGGSGTPTTTPTGGGGGGTPTTTPTGGGGAGTPTTTPTGGGGSGTPTTTPTGGGGGGTPTTTPTGGGGGGTPTVTPTGGGGGGTPTTTPTGGGGGGTPTNTGGASRTPTVTPTTSGRASTPTTTPSGGATNTRTPIVGQSSLASAITATDTTIPLTDASRFPSSGTIRIDNEEITYTGKSGNTLTGATRGANGTTATAHLAGAQVNLVPATNKHDDDSCAIVAPGNSQAGWMLLLPAAILLCLRRRSR